MKNKEKKILGSKKKRAKSFNKNNSPGVGYYLITDKESKSVRFKFISNHIEFKQSISHLDHPSFTTDEEFLKENKFLDMALNSDNYNKNKKYPFPFNKINLKKTFFIENEKDFFFKNDKLKTGNLVFSNIFCCDNKYEEEIFANIHTYRNNYFRECYISEFCPDYKMHFPNNNNDVFYQINEDEFFIVSFKVFHYRDIPNGCNSPSGGVAHFYSPKGTGKSILFRSILTNFCDPEDKYRYNPIMFFNIKLLNELKNKNDFENLKKILIREAYSLYDKSSSAFELVKNIGSNSSIMEIILQIIKKAIKDLIKLDRLKVFIIDGYSSEYDTQGILKDIINLIKEKKDIKYEQFFVYIIHDILNEEDAECLYKNIAPKNYINYNTEDFESYYYFEKLKKFSELKKNFATKEIPENYEDVFGENVSFFFEYKTMKNMLFNDFVKTKKSVIKNEILDFYSGNNSMSKYYLNDINENYIKKGTKFTYNEIIKRVPSNYIEIIIEPKPNHQSKGFDIKNYNRNKLYSLKYSFPLIKDVIEEIISDRYFINMKDPKFLELPPGILGMNFDYEMIKIFQELMENKFFFEHESKIKIFVDDIIEKSDKSNAQIYSLDKISSKIHDKMVKKKLSFIKINFEDYTCIGVFQNNPNGKAFDALFILREKDKKEFNMHLIQIKVSDSYKEKEKDLINNVAYAKEKFKYLLNIMIDKTYLSYLSIWQKKKDFAESHPDKTFLYDVIKEQFVDFEGVEYKNFPILGGAIINPVQESSIINEIINKIIGSCNTFVKLIKKEKNLTNFNEHNQETIENNLCDKEVYVNVSPSKFYFCYKLNNLVESVSRKGKNDYNIDFEGIFDILVIN